MPKPRVFVSSTYYDLKYIRNNLNNFIESMGYEPVMFEHGSFYFNPDETIESSCYSEVAQCQIMILIIGGRYGSKVSDSASSQKDNTSQVKHSVRGESIQIAESDDIFRKYNSITAAEYQTAIKEQLPIYIFIEKDVLAEYDTYKKNKNVKISWAHVDNPNVFCLIDEIHSQFKGNYIKAFEKFEDIENWLVDQWAGLVFDHLSNKKRSAEIKALDSKLEELSVVVSSLRQYSEFLLTNMGTKGSKELIGREKRKVLLSKFRNEDLIDFIFRIANRDSEYPLEMLFTNLIQSKDFVDFLAKCSFTEVQIDEINKYRDIALHDYDRIKKDYLLFLEK